MKKAIVIGAVMIMFLAGDSTQAGVCLIMNGSFEDDGYIADITTHEPNGWVDVNVPAGKFTGWVSSDWVTSGSYNLTLSSYWYVGFEANDIAMVSQEVYLTDVNEIIFDLKLQTYPFNNWNPSKRTAVVMIDGVEVWNSDDYLFPSNGEYRNQVIPVDVLDRNLHKLSLGIRADVNETSADTQYYALWDSMELNCHCGGFGFLLEDFSRNCYVDMSDVYMLADVWLNEIAEDDPDGRYNLYRNDEMRPRGYINFFDFAVFSSSWNGNMPDLKMLVEQWLDDVAPDSDYNYYHADDVPPRGIINFSDFAVFSTSWDGNMHDLKMFVDVWLNRVYIDNAYNLYHGDDVNPRRIINFLDFAIFADSWLRSSYDQGN
jgi:hypothetical protein